MLTFDEKKRLRDAASGKEECDLVVKNVTVVDVLGLTIFKADLMVKDGRFAGFGPASGRTEIDGTGLYAAPNYIDPHMHVESSLMTPANLTDLFLPQGIGTLVADPHEIANVAGADGIRYMIEASEGLPMDVVIQLPSTVPCTNMENSGAVLGAEELRPFYSSERVGGLAEVMNTNALTNSDDMLHKVFDAREVSGKLADGHISTNDSHSLDVYAAMGVTNDHVCMSAEGLALRIARGIDVFIVRGSVADKLPMLVPMVNSGNWHRVSFCTDDEHPDDFVRMGGVNGMVREAIELGLDPIMALAMATANPARSCGLRDRGALAPGMRADFFLFDDLSDPRAAKVFVSGKLVAENGRMLCPCGEREPVHIDRVSDSVNYKPFDISQLAIDLKGADRARVIVTGATAGTLGDVQTVKTDENGCFIPDTERDQAKLFVIERHNATGNIGRAIVSGFGLKKGAIASTVAHDSHNIVVVGVDDGDIMLAVETLKKIKGGYVFAMDGAVRACVPLEIGGLMTDSSAQKVLAELDAFHSAIEPYTRKDINPLAKLSFISLPVVPRLKITDMGLVDVKEWRIVPVAAADLPLGELE